MGESFFMGGGEASWFVVEMILSVGVEVQLFVGGGLFVRRVGKFFSSFNEKTFRCLLREEEFIPGRGDAFG